MDEPLNPLFRMTYRLLAEVQPRLRRAVDRVRRFRPVDLATALRGLLRLGSFGPPTPPSREIPALLVNRLAQVALPAVSWRFSRRLLRARFGIPAGRKAVLLEGRDPGAPLVERAREWLRRRDDVMVLCQRPAGLLLPGFDLAIATTCATADTYLRLGVPTLYLPAAGEDPLRSRIGAAHHLRAAMVVTHPAFLEEALALALTAELAATLRAQLSRFWRRDPAGAPPCE